MESSTVQQLPAWVSFVPLLVYVILFAVLVIWLAPRKGRSRLLALAAVIPFVGPLIVIYLLSITDKQVLDDIESLKKQIVAR